MSETTFTRQHGPVTTEQFVRFATLLNDFNPAHYDLEFARGVGLPGVIGPGTLLQGWLLADVESELERPTAATTAPHGVTGIDLRLKQSYLAGETVEITYTVEDEHIEAVLTASIDGGEPRRIATAVITTSALERTAS